MQLYLATIVLSSMIAVFFIHVMLLRVFRLFRQPFTRQRGVIISFFVGIAPVGVAFYLFVTKYRLFNSLEIIWFGLYLLAVYISYSYIYFHVFNMSETARRIRILIQCRSTSAVEVEKLIDKYTCADMVSNRLKRLVNLKELYSRGDKYVLGRSLLLLPARWLYAFRKILRLK